MSFERNLSTVSGFPIPLFRIVHLSLFSVVEFLELVGLGVDERDWNPI